MFDATYGALMIAGLLGSLGHCLGMCGPLLAMMGAQTGGGPLPGRLAKHALYHAARLTTYAALGAAAGALGSFLGMHGALIRIAGPLSILAGVAMVLFSITRLGWLRLEKADCFSAWLVPAMRVALRERGYGGVALLGLLNGLLPCCLLYPALLAAAGLGGVIPGMAGMLAFGAGTVPALFVVGMGAGMLAARTRQELDHAARFAVAILGIQLVLRGLATLGVLASRSVGPVVLW